MTGTTQRRKVLSASGGYFVSQGLVMLSAFISMPIMTRLLSKQEYGLLNLVLASVGILALLGRLGFPQATVRFYAERAKEGPAQLREFCNSMLGGALAASVVVGLASALFVTEIAPNPEHRYAQCVRVAALVVVVRVVLSVVYQILRAQERVVAYSGTQILARFSTLVVAVPVLLFYNGQAYEVILATFIGEAIAALACVVDLIRRGVLSWPALSRSAISLSVSYGLPLVAASSASLILDYGDRFVIERVLNLDAVATYAVPYDLTQNVATAVFGPVSLAVVPILLRLWAQEGPEATIRLLSQIASYLIALAIPFAVLVLLMNQDLIVLLASSKYANSAALTPYLLPGVFAGELNFLFVLGLMVEKSTVTLALMTVAASVLNVGLNLLFVPRWGLPGAAIATTISYGLLVGGTYLKSRSVLPLRLQYGLIAKSVLATAIMAILVRALEPVSVSSPLVMSIAVRGVVGASVIAICLWVLDPQTRALIGLRAR
jgi:O-antigen/teichoic acid export membrane protein